MECMREKLLILDVTDLIYFKLTSSLYNDGREDMEPYLISCLL